MLNELFVGMIFQIGVGDKAKGIEDIFESFNQAWYSISYGEMIYGKKNDFIVCYNDYSFLKIFSRLKETDSIKEIIPKELCRLNEYDIKNKTDFYESLKVYLDCNCNGKKAAEKLFIHYKTMLYRLNKIKDFFGIDLENSTSRVYIELGIQLLEMTNEYI